MSCQHSSLYKGVHSSFRNGWLCPTCGEIVQHEDIDYDAYSGAVIAMFRKDLLNEPTVPS